MNKQKPQVLGRKQGGNFISISSTKHVKTVQKAVNTADGTRRRHTNDVMSGAGCIRSAVGMLKVPEQILRIEYGGDIL